MADDKLQQKLVDYIQAAHAMEQNVSRMLDSMMATTDDPEITEMLKHHQQETGATSRGCASAWTPWERAPPRVSRHRP